MLPFARSWPGVPELIVSQKHMSLVNTDVIDIVTLVPGKTRVALVIVDDGLLPDDQSREQALQKKLTSYLQFVVSGQFARTYPDLLDRDLLISVVCTNRPSDEMRKIKGIRDHVHPETFLPVEVGTETEFRARLKKSADAIGEGRSSGEQTG